MKKQTTKPRTKAPAKSQKVDLSTLESFAIAHFIYVALVGVIAFFMLLDIGDKLKSIKYDVTEIQDNSYRTLNNARLISDNTNETKLYSQLLYEASQKKVGKK
jgi:hypothetical protein